MPMPREDMTYRRLLETASLPYRQADRYAWYFARGKLGRDPVFRYLLSGGLILPGEHVLDIGCGQGLLASLLHAVESTCLAHWPSSWAAPPVGASVTGIELAARDVARARCALNRASGISFICGDLRETPFPPCNAAVMLDVLHYLPIVDQNAALQRVFDTLPVQGRLLLRVGDAHQRSSFLLSQLTDRIVLRLRGQRGMRITGRPLSQWLATLQRIGFATTVRPMSEGTPFANMLIVAVKSKASG